MTDYSSFELSAYQRARLAADEQVFWCGKTRASAMFDGWPIVVIFGAVACAFICPMLWKVLGHVAFNEHTPLAVRIFFALFCVPFAAFGLGFLLSPLWHWILTRGSVWAITDRRVVRFFGPFAKTWWREKMFERVVWAKGRRGCHDFAFAEHWVSSKGGHMATDCIAGVRQEDVPFVEAAFHRLEEIKRAGDAVRQSEAVAAAEKRFRVFTDAGRTRIVYRRRRIAKGVALLTFVLAFFATMAWFVFAKDNEAHWIAVLFCLPLVLACAPSVYDLFGRREIALANGRGVYFNGVGAIGIRRHFTYDATTTIRIGQTQYRMNGKGLPEAQLLTPGQHAPRRLFAHPDEEVVEVFVRHLREAMKAQD